MKRINNESEFSSIFAGCFSKLSREKSFREKIGMISCGNLRRGAQDRTGIVQVPSLRSWSECHGSFKTNVLTPCTATPWTGE
jgi:hypothetical protein